MAKVTENALKAFLKVNIGDGSGSGYGDGYGSGYGDGDGDGSGSGSGDGYGYGSGSGYGDGDGSGSGYGSGYGDGDGSGSGSGYGDGYGSGSGYGDGYGYGYGYGIKSYNDMPVCVIDGVQTVIRNIFNCVAKGYILNDDLTLTKCFVAKYDPFFAHGKTVEEAFKALQDKRMANLDTETTISEFLKEFKSGEKYKGAVFFDWHHYLTGSCEMGRRQFVETHGFDLNADYTVDEFIEATKEDFGGEVIKKLKAAWENQARI
jgi:hypothetical protein